MALFGLTYLASLERTPISGRLRSMLLSESEERALRVALIGSNAPVYPHDWLVILRQVLSEEASPPDTLLGGRVLDPQLDWRPNYVEATLRLIEAGIDPLYWRASEPQLLAGLRIPPVDYPLQLRPRPVDNSPTSVRPRYPVLVVDRPEANAFSFGFAPDGDEVGPGCIVVFTGFLDSILGPSEFLPEPPKSTTSMGLGSGLFNAIFPKVEEKRFYVNPTREQTEQLAVLLCHELSQ